MGEEAQEADLVVGLLDLSLSSSLLSAEDLVKVPGTKELLTGVQERHGGVQEVCKEEDKKYGVRGAG